MAEREMINVGCKLASGIRLHIMKRLEKPLTEGAPPFKDMGFIDLAGPSALHALPPGVARRTEAFTSVDKERFEIWRAENEDNPLLTGGTIFVQEPDRKEPEADAEAAEREKEIRDETGPARTV